MAKHTVSVSLPERELGRADAEFSVKADGKALGQLKISNGAAVWTPKGKQYGQKLTWQKLAQLFEEHGSEGHK